MTYLLTYSWKANNPQSQEVKSARSREPWSWRSPLHAHHGGVLSRSTIVTSSKHSKNWTRWRNIFKKQVQDNIIPRIQHLIDIIKVSIERQQKETSQLYKNIDISIDHAITQQLLRGSLIWKKKKHKSIWKERVKWRGRPLQSCHCSICSHWHCVGPSNRKSKDNLSFLTNGYWQVTLSIDWLLWQI